MTSLEGLLTRGQNPRFGVSVKPGLAHEHGALRNGQSANVIDVTEPAGRLTLQLGDGREVSLDQAQIASADVRLSYVQHPFPAQGHTTDTAHLILAKHITAEGSYVALTRAREHTRIYASSDQLDRPGAEHNHIQALAERMSRTEPELPSIHTPTAHEHTITTDQHQQTITPACLTATTPSPRQPVRCDDSHQQHPGSHLTSALGSRPGPSDPGRGAWEHAAAAIERYRSSYGITDPNALGPEPSAGHFQQRHDRRQTAEQVLRALDLLARSGDHRGSLEERILNTPGLAHDNSQPDRTIGWEP